LNYFGNFKNSLNSLNSASIRCQLLNSVNKMIENAIQVKLTPSWSILYHKKHDHKHITRTET